MNPRPAEAAIRAEIARRGPIPFADFMALALGHPEGGYYAAAAPPDPRGRLPDGARAAPGLRGGAGPAGRRGVGAARPATPFTLVEYGAGAGTLALAILAGLRDDGSPLADALAYAPVELNRHRMAELGARAAAAGLPVVDAAGLDDGPRGRRRPRE